MKSDLDGIDQDRAGKFGIFDTFAMKRAAMLT